MTAHGTVAFVVHEQDAEIAVRRIGRQQQATVHIGMTPGFEHQRLAEVVVMIANVPAARQYGVAFQFGKTRYNDPERLPAGVHVNGPDA